MPNYYEYKYNQWLMQNKGEHKEIFTINGILIANSFSNIVHGGRGAYVEFNKNQIIVPSLHLPNKENWRIASDLAFYIEFHTFSSVH